MKNLIFILLIACIVLTSGCATIFTGTKQKVTFISNAKGKVFQNLTEIGNTNEPIKVKRKDLVKLYTIKADGFKDKSIELKIKNNPACWLNVPFCFVGIGLIGAYLDAENGANIKTAKTVTVDLESK
jgi:hypothetical protein